MLDFILKNKEWLFEGIGVLLTSLVLTGTGYLIRLIYLKYFVYSSHIKNYEGCYDLYHYRPSNNGEIVKGCVQISWSWLGRLEVIVTSHRYKFIGSLKVIYHNLFIDLESEPRRVKQLLVFSEPLNEFNFLVGTYASISLNGTPVCGKILLVKALTYDISKMKSEDISADKVSPAIKSLLDIESSLSVSAQLPSSPFIEQVKIP